MSDANREVRFCSDQVYSHAGGVPRFADLYLPSQGGAPLPAVIWLHGGGWRFGDRRMAPDLALFARRSGLAVVSIDYRLSDEARFPAQVVDVKTAVRWVRSVADQFGLDEAHIGLWGSSAGGHLAACAALSPAHRFTSDEYGNHSSAVQAVVDGYGPTNFARIDADRAQVQAARTDAEGLLVGNVLPAAHPESFESRLLGAPVGTSPELVERANPVHYVRPGNAPFLILHGEADTLIPWQQSRLLFDALNAVRNDATLILFEKLTHGFFNNRALAEADLGAVTVHRSQTDLNSRNLWTSDPSADIPNLVASFFKAHLAAH